MDCLWPCLTCEGAGYCLTCYSNASLVEGRTQFHP